MRILIVSSYLPFPLFSGGAVRLYNLIKQLSKKHKITLVCEKRSTQGEDDIKELKKLCEEVITINRKKQWSKENILKSGFSLDPFLVVGHTLPEMKQILVSLLTQKHFDLVHIETFYVFQNVPKTYLPTVLVEHNIEYKVYERYMLSAPVYMRPLLALDIAKIKRAEKFAWMRATKLIAVSEEEKKDMTRSDVVVVPNGVDTTSFSFQKSAIKYKRKTKTVLFMGDFKWIQNQESAKDILTQIWPLLKGTMANQKMILWIVGKNIPEYIKNLGDESIVFDEAAPDQTWKIYQKADVLLSPIRVGGGTSYKILEAMASGVPVVTTNLGVVGIGAKHMEEALVGETAEELAHAVTKVLTDEKIFTNIAEKARQLIEVKYSWEQIAKDLDNVYASTIV